MSKRNGKIHRARPREPETRPPIEAAGLPADLVVLSLDPSSQACGWAVLHPGETPQTFGVYRPGAHRALESRIDRTADWIADLVDLHAPDVVLIEMAEVLHHKATPRSIISLARAQEAVRQAVRRSGKSPHKITPEEWTGRARKEDRSRELAMWCGPYRAVQTKDRGGDIADAIGCGLWWLDQQRAAELMGKRA